MKPSRIFVALVATVLPFSAAFADETVVPIHKVSSDGIGAAIGTITLKDGHQGLIVAPDLPPGGHYDPAGKGHGMKHGGHGKAMMHDKPHGDLPQLVAAADGTATEPVTNDKLKVAQIRGRAIMVHRYGENDPGKPKGGGPRYACGVIPK